MYYTFDRKNSIHVPAPFGRYMTPIFMGDDPVISDCAFSVHMTEWEPGCKVDNHTHEAATEAMYCMEGSGIAQVDGKEYPFFPGAMIVAPPHVTHQIINTGDTMLRVLCIFSPPNTAKGLRDRANQAVEAARKAEE